MCHQTLRCFDEFSIVGLDITAYAQERQARYFAAYAPPK